jgi:hypothetical protein
MFLIIAAVLAVAYAALKPLSEGLFDTSLWVAKVLAPPDSEESETSKQFLKAGQAALMEGWLSNIPFISAIFSILSVASGFIYCWWAGPLVFFGMVILGVVTKHFWLRPISYYLPMLYHKMVNRAADYTRDGDVERATAAESYCGDLEQLMLLYKDSKLKPPTPKQLKDVPYGDMFYWLERGPQYLIQQDGVSS